MSGSDSLITHFESFLGPIAGGWSEGADGVRLPFQVVRFDEAPSDDLTTYATLGLSRHLLHTPTKSIRQELLMTVEKSFATTNVVGILAVVGESILAQHRALIRGEVLPPAGPVVPGSSLEAL